MAVTQHNLNGYTPGCHRCEGLPNWAVLNGVLPRGIRPTDIDHSPDVGLIEIRRHFLFMEWKRPSEEMKSGQINALLRLGDCPLHELHVIQGSDTAHPTWLHVRREGVVLYHGEIDLLGWRAYVAGFGDWADGRPTP